MRIIIAIICLLAASWPADAQRRPAQQNQTQPQRLRAGETAPRLALVDANNKIVRIVQTKTIDPNAPLKQGFKWLPIPKVDSPMLGADEVIDGEWPTLVVGQTSVAETYPKRTKNAGELETDKTLAVDGIDVAVFRALCQLNNDVRAMKTPPQPALNAAQCKTALKALIQ